MTDFEYDVFCKKQIARGAFHKVNGSKSRKCMLPTDGMTAKQLQNMSKGETIVYNINKPMNYETFIKLPASSAVSYIKGLREKYGANYTWLSEMFGKDKRTIARVLSAEPYNIKIAPGGRNSDLARKEWLEFISGDDTKVSETASESPEQDKTPIEVEAEKTEVKIATPKPERPKMQFKNCSLEFSGKFDTCRILNTLNAIVGSGCNVTVKIDVSFEEGNSV